MNIDQLKEKLNIERLKLSFLFITIVSVMSWLVLNLSNKINLTTSFSVLYLLIAGSFFSIIIIKIEKLINKMGNI